MYNTKNSTYQPFILIPISCQKPKQNCKLPKPEVKKEDGKTVYNNCTFLMNPFFNNGSITENTYFNDSFNDEYNYLTNNNYYQNQNRMPYFPFCNYNSFQQSSPYQQFPYFLMPTYLGGGIKQEQQQQIANINNNQNLISIS